MYRCQKRLQSNIYIYMHNAYEYTLVWCSMTGGSGQLVSIVQSEIKGSRKVVAFFSGSNPTGAWKCVGATSPNRMLINMQAVFRTLFERPTRNRNPYDIVPKAYQEPESKCKEIHFHSRPACCNQDHETDRLGKPWKPWKFGPLLSYGRENSLVCGFCTVWPWKLPMYTNSK